MGKCIVGGFIVGHGGKYSLRCMVCSGGLDGNFLMGRLVGVDAVWLS